MTEIAKKHLHALGRALGLWTVQPIVHQGAGKVRVTLAEHDSVLLNPSTARAFGNALLQAAAEAATETE